MSRFATRDFDDVFTDIERDAQGRGGITVHGAKQSISVTVGPKFRTMLLYSTVPNPATAPGAGLPGLAAGAAAPPPVSTGPAVPLSATDNAPEVPTRGFVAIEPMVAITDAMNLAQKGLYKELQSVPPGGSWEESFWVTPRGY
jgi:aldose 1-epimerase